ncbi:MAG TPA: phosphonate utilization associated transcriptional regulator [Casimicrobiaceae bacterium]|jgi:phosphonate utilization transcriptional regulator|nr:phosphonate utilization associated transcriptional regulator [Casimicrobiaceae bacterium]
MATMLKSGSANPVRVAARARAGSPLGAAGSDAVRPANSASIGGTAAGPRRRLVADDHPIALIQAHSLPALVQSELSRMILAGDLPAGAQLREAEIASMLGVSRGPVREAFRALEESGLVRLEKNRGVFVRQIDIDEADQIFELRAVLDEFAGRRAAQRATPAEAAELRALVDRMDSAVARGDVDGYHAANIAFHDRIVELAGNVKLTFVYRRLVNELNLHRRASLAQAGILPVSIREHRAIVDRIAAKQPAAAGRALHEHAMSSRERVHRTNAPPTRARKAR